MPLVLFATLLLPVCYCYCFFLFLSLCHCSGSSRYVFRLFLSLSFESIVSVSLSVRASWTLLHNVLKSIGHISPNFKALVHASSFGGKRSKCKITMGSGSMENALLALLTHYLEKYWIYFLQFYRNGAL